MTSPRLHSWPGRAALSRRPFRVASRDRPFLDLFSRGRACPSESRGFSPAQIEQIQRTVMGRTPEVMVKVTGGGRRVGAVAAHLILHQPARETRPRDGRWAARVQGGPEGAPSELASGAHARPVPATAW